MSKNSSKQLVEQLQGWISWITAASRKGQNQPKKYDNKKTYPKR